MYRQKVGPPATFASILLHAEQLLLQELFDGSRDGTFPHPRVRRQAADARPTLAATAHAIHDDGVDDLRGRR